MTVAKSGSPRGWPRRFFAKKKTKFTRKNIKNKNVLDLKKMEETMYVLQKVDHGPVHCKNERRKNKKKNLHCVRPKKDEGKSPQKDERKPKKR